jgi:hypothetical protein
VSGLFGPKDSDDCVMGRYYSDSITTALPVACVERQGVERFGMDSARAKRSECSSRGKP